MTLTNDSFTAQLPALFNTGVIRQFLPRLNSSLIYDAVDVEEFPSGCNTIPGSFYVEYTGQAASNDNYSIQACMPGNLTQSPWRNTRKRQDITELLYLKLTLNIVDTIHKTAVFMVQANSSAGYFELPNYINGGVPGPLLLEGPKVYCDEHCLP